MSWKPANESDVVRKEKLDNENNETSIHKKTFDNMDLVDRRDKLGKITSTLSPKGKENFDRINWRS